MVSAGQNLGKVVQVIGPVVDVAFNSEKLPLIYTALKIENATKGMNITLEVAQHLGNNTVRSVSLASTDGLVRGMAVIDTGSPIKVPVGRATLGRLLDLLGNPIDNLGPIQASDYYHIHRATPKLEEQETTPRVFETGLK